MKGDPEDTDTRMSDAGDENSFARANQGDSPEWTTRPAHIIQAAPHAEDSVTHNISNNNPEEGEYPAQPDEAVSSPPSMFPATTADGAVFYMQDTSQAARSGNSEGPAKSDVSMAAQSQAHDAPPELAEVAGRFSEPRESATASNYRVGAPPGPLNFSTAENTLTVPSEANAVLADMQPVTQSESYQAIDGDDWEGHDLAPLVSDDDGYRSDIEEFQDISDDDVPKRDLLGSHISPGNDRAA